MRRPDNRFFSARSYVIVDSGYKGVSFRQFVLMRKSPVRFPSLADAVMTCLRLVQEVSVEQFNVSPGALRLGHLASDLAGRTTGSISTRR